MKQLFLGVLVMMGAVLTLPAAAQDTDQTNVDSRITIVAKRDAALLPPPSQPLSAYSRIEIEPLTYSKQVQADPRKVERAKDLEVRFTPRIQKSLDAWNAKATTNAGADQKKLIIKPNIQSLKIVSGGARFFAGVLSGDSTISVYMQFVDPASGAIVAGPTIVKSSGAFAGAWSFGATDTNLMNYVGETANQYILLHLNTPTDQPAPAEAAPAEAAQPPAPAPATPPAG